MNRTNYIFIDVENVQETDLERIANKPVQVTLILGERHKSLPIKLVRLIQKYPTQVRLVETVLNGKNALDFVLAYEVGIASEKDPNGYFHILSRDNGFDALIKHDIRAARHIGIMEILVLMNAPERIKFLESFFTTKKNRPKKRKTLESQIHAMFGKTLSTEEVEQTIEGLITTKIIALTDKDQVTYKSQNLAKFLELPGANPLKDVHAALGTAILNAYGFSAERDLLA